MEEKKCTHNFDMETCLEYDHSEDRKRW